MHRHYGILSLVLFLIYITGWCPASPATIASPCERAPRDAASGDSDYLLSVAGDPDLFLAGELYTVSLKGVDSGQGPTPFVGFVLWIEIVEDSENENKNSTLSNSLSLGALQAYDAQTKPYEACKPAVDNATAHPKTEVQVIWSSPSVIIDYSCIRLCARTKQADGSKSSILARKLCPAPAGTANMNPQPPILEPCCACDEAKYEVTFEGLWSPNTHPREFPPEGSRAHFGDVIGASHNAQYRVWQEGRIASPGLRKLADDGSTRTLEKELKAESEHIRTIIKARGISWQQVAGVGTPTTFAVFRVDAKHHLVSLAAKLAPSPDWIVGISALELCIANCTWRTAATLPLYPYDAGTDNGLNFTAGRSPTVPKAPVRALRSEWPKDTRSGPFLSTSGEMRPFARLRLTRLRLYEKSCDATESNGVNAPELPAPIGSSCATYGWGAWGPCSATCGLGRAARQRHYMWPLRAHHDACRTVLTEYRQCHGPRLHCRVKSDYEPEAAESSGPCAMSPWSEWSPCEGCGVRARSRHYLAPRAHKRCHVGFRARAVMSQARPCDAGPCNGPSGEHANVSNFDWFFMDDPKSSCPVTPWASWSPCSSRCARGRRLRTRLYVTRDPPLQREISKRLLRDWNQRFAELQNLELPYENITSKDPILESSVQKHLERCQFTMTQQEALCDGEDSHCQNHTLPKGVCDLPMSVGPCRGYDERWFHTAGTCEPFGYTGCGGNNNNFATRESCERTCLNRRQGTGNLTSSLIEANAKRIKATPSTEDNEVMQSDASIADVNCEMGPWLGWSECVGECDFAIKLNYRHIVVSPSGLGKACQKMIKSRPCKPTHCKKKRIFANNTENASDDNDY